MNHERADKAIAQSDVAAANAVRRRRAIKEAQRIARIQRILTGCERPKFRAPVYRKGKR